MRVLLAGLGVFVLGVTCAIWLVPADDSVSTVVETSTIAVESTPSPTSGQGPSGTGESATTGTAAQDARAKSNTVSTKKTETTTPPGSRRTDAALALLVAVGLGLVLVGAFFDRITTIKAAGVEVGLGAKVAGAIAAKTTPETPEEIAKVRAAYVLALDEIPPGTSPGDDPVIESAAESALETVGVDHE